MARIVAPPALATGTSNRAKLGSSLALGRACGGALLFGLPLLLTEEMWDLAVHIDPLRLALHWLLALPMLVGLAHYFGFEKTDTVLDATIDAFAAITIGTAVAATVLSLVCVIDLDTPPRVAMTELALQALPCTIGALLAQSQIHDRRSEPPDRGPSPGYPGALLPMIVGALYLGLPFAPTEEVATIASRMSTLGLVVLVAATLAVNDAFAAAGAREASADATGPPLMRFVIFTVVSYTVALALAAYVLWFTGRLDGVSVTAAASVILVLGFPMSVGATAARVIL